MCYYESTMLGTFHLITEAYLGPFQGFLTMNGWQGRNYFSYSDHDQTKIICNSGHYKDRTYSVIPVQIFEEKTKRLKEVVDMAYSKTSDK